MDIPPGNQGDGFQFSQYASYFPELNSGLSSANQNFQPHAFSFLRQLFGADTAQSQGVESDLIAEVARQGSGTSKRGKTTPADSQFDGVTTRAGQQNKGSGLVAGL